jgi:outer membrane lipoprotein SlyB
VINTVGGFPMSDFIPGEAYRLDIVGADESVLVDSWTSQIKASVVARDGTLQVDVDSGKIYGPLIGDIHDLDGSVIFDSITKTLIADIKGNILDLEGNIIVDIDLGIVNANLNGSVYDANGLLLIDSANRTIDADAVYGTFYGDLIGNVTTENTMFGTFSGDFNGSHYGEFYGDIMGNLTGTVTGDVVGNVTGIVTGSLIGEIMADANTSLISKPDEQYSQYNWLGGIGHPAEIQDGDVAKGPIVVLGETRADSHVVAHINNYDGRPVVHLDQIGNSPWVAHHFGKFRGELYSNDDKSIVSYNQNTGQVYIKSYSILTLDVNDGNSDLDIVVKNTNINTNGDVVVSKFNGTWENKSQLNDRDGIITMTGIAYNGNGFVETGIFGIFAENKTEHNRYTSGFSIVLDDGINGPDYNLSNSLLFDSRGLLSIPKTKLTGTTFAQRDSAPAEEGMIIFNKNSKKFQGYTGTEWVDLH